MTALEVWGEPMAETLPTMKISDGHGGFIIINEEDFDSKLHKKFLEKEAPKETEDEEPKRVKK